MKIQDSEIVARIEEEENIAYGVNDATLSNDRAEAIDYYLGEPFGNEIEGRSQVVSFDVQDTIESALPQLLKVFVVSFTTEFPCAFYGVTTIKKPLCINLVCNC